MTGPNLRVLIVDDEALGRQRLEDLLRHEEGVEIAGFADNGDSAIEAIRTLKPNLVFLDVQMPRRTGLEVVRDIGPEHMPPTIFVTASPSRMSASWTSTPPEMPARFARLSSGA